jgi:hypothetical protein
VLPEHCTLNISIFIAPFFHYSSLLQGVLEILGLVRFRGLEPLVDLTSVDWVNPNNHPNAIIARSVNLSATSPNIGQAVKQQQQHASKQTL